MQRDYDYDELYPGRFLKAVEFQGKDVTLTIVAVDIEEMPDKKGNKVNKDGERVKVKPLLTFAKPNGQPVEKQLVMNRTNGECLKGMFGRKVSGWIGKRVTLYPATVEAFGEEQLAIRVRGSPDIAADMALELRLGQKTRKATMKRTGATKAAAKAAAAPPPPPVEPAAGLPPGLDDAPETPADELEQFTQGFTGN